jgi:hypothetical protein
VGRIRRGRGRARTASSSPRDSTEIVCTLVVAPMRLRSSRGSAVCARAAPRARLKNRASAESSTQFRANRVQSRFRIIRSSADNNSRTRNHYQVVWRAKRPRAEVLKGERDTSACQRETIPIPHLCARTRRAALLIDYQYTTRLRRRAADVRPPRPARREPTSSRARVSVIPYASPRRVPCLISHPLAPPPASAPARAPPAAADCRNVPVDG